MNEAFIQLAIAEVMPAALATGLFVSTFTAQTPTNVIGPTGQPSETYVNVDGLVNIPCTAPPITDGSIQATEVKDLEEITASELHHVLLNGYYPALDAGWRGEAPNGTGGWVASITWKGVAWLFDIMGAESDSQSQMTRVKVKLATL